MKKLLQINVTANWGSTGKIAEDIGRLVMENGWESWIAYGRGLPESKSHLVRIGKDWDVKMHAIQTRLFDRHGLGSKDATLKFVSDIERIAPDIIHLHNIHGYYLNYPILFGFLKEYDAPIVWTFHDCWPFTGHCAYYDFVKCNRWKYGCYSCPQLRSYPISLVDNSKRNWINKKNCFTPILDKIHVVTVSNWLKNQVEHSFFHGVDATRIYNGIDLQTFYPREQGRNKQFVILGVASAWDSRKGLDVFLKLRSMLPLSYKIILIGLTGKQIKSLPNGIKGIQRTESVDELAKYYSMADVYVNTSVEETLGMTSLEAQACGTPSIVYNSTACPETICAESGIVVNPGKIQELVDAIKTIELKGKSYYQSAAVNWVKSNFDKSKQYKEYLDLYKQIVKE
jgi:glycosyltransferase involved in cell wall biosynthesis